MEGWTCARRKQQDPVRLRRHRRCIMFWNRGKQPSTVGLFWERTILTSFLLRPVRVHPGMWTRASNRRNRAKGGSIVSVWSRSIHNEQSRSPPGVPSVAFHSAIWCSALFFLHGTPALDACFVQGCAFRMHRCNNFHFTLSRCRDAMNKVMVPFHPFVSSLFPASRFRTPSRTPRVHGLGMGSSTPPPLPSPSSLFHAPRFLRPSTRSRGGPSLFSPRENPRSSLFFLSFSIRVGAEAPSAIAISSVAPPRWRT